MPALSGENLLTTLFADVHYYFSDPSAKPLHHRFDRGSYVYLYHNPSSSEGKVEVANHAGTADQDAFSGYLRAAGATVHYSYKQPTLCTLKVPTASPQDRSQWHLPAFDEHNQQKYLYKIHSLDIYLWTEKDAATFLRVIRSVLPNDKVEVRDAPPEHRDSMSPVVQQLERTAISGQAPVRTGSTNSSHPSMPGPPTPVAPGVATASTPTTAAPTMAYNPAAPAAPEPIAHREKTPPPPDAATGTGLSSNGQYPGQQSYNPNQAFMPQQSSYGGSFAGPPQQAAGGVPPPPPGGPNRQSSLSFAGPPSASSTPQPGTSPPPQQQASQHQSFGPSQTQYSGYPQQTQSYQPGTSATPPYGLQTPLQSPGLPPPPAQNQQYQQHQQSGTPVGGYNSYDYSGNNSNAQQQQSFNQYGAYTGNVHGQGYRPTEAEASHGGTKPSQATPETKGSKVGKKVDGFLKRLDKMI